MATSNYDTLQLQVGNESQYEMGFRKLTDALTIYDLISKSSIVVPYNSIINRYRYYLEPYIDETELTEEQFQIFKQNPQGVSEALYGTIHFWNIILELNNCISRLSFTKRKIKYYRPSIIFQIINDVQLKDAEEKTINIH